MTNVEVALIAILIGVFGVGGGKLLGNKKFKEYKDICKSIHVKCKEDRMAMEKKLEREILEQIKPRLILGNLIMAELADKVGIDPQKIKQFENAVKIKINDK